MFTAVFLQVRNRKFQAKYRLNYYEEIILFIRLVSASVKKTQYLSIQIFSLSMDLEGNDTLTVMR